MCCKCIVLVLCLYGYVNHLNDKVRQRPTHPPIAQKKNNNKKLCDHTTNNIYTYFKPTLRLKVEGGGVEFQLLSFREVFRLSLNYYSYICQLMDFADRNSIYQNKNYCLSKATLFLRETNRYEEYGMKF